jgi:hypothetical protein
MFRNMELLFIIWLPLKSSFKSMCFYIEAKIVLHISSKLNSKALYRGAQLPLVDTSKAKKLIIGA